MKRFIVCLLVVLARFECISAMYCNIELTERQQKLYTQLAEECGVSDLRNCAISQKNQRDSDFLRVLEQTLIYAENATNFVIESREERSKDTDETMVRAMLCRECGSLLASLADFFEQEEILISLKTNADVMGRMKKIGLIR